MSSARVNLLLGGRDIHNTDIKSGKREKTVSNVYMFANSLGGWLRKHSSITTQQLTIIADPYSSYIRKCSSGENKNYCSNK